MCKPSFTPEQIKYLEVSLKLALDAEKAELRQKYKNENEALKQLLWEIRGKCLGTDLFWSIAELEQLFQLTTRSNYPDFADKKNAEIKELKDEIKVLKAKINWLTDRNKHHCAVAYGG
ncbi:MAG: hypothetical protein KAR20_11390 [Candidatus Heimdallarchaeota archaeon]|nr:hypothetical protein [Candidatus Heimdallarchaeota archaeon]